MDKNSLLTLLQQVKNGTKTVSEAAHTLENLPHEEIEHACLDHHRPLRTGIPEVIFGAGKSAVQVAAIMEKIVAHSGRCLATKITPDKAEAVMDRISGCRFHESANALTVGIETAERSGLGAVLVVAAGTSDIAIAEEAVLTLQFLGHRVETLYDVGVAGIHRLLGHKSKLDTAAVIIVVAGMEGALPSVVGGIVSCPVIGVPTSIGYGTGFGGMAALLAMLNSCTPGITVVNIDNGFGAACAAAAINRME